MLGAMIKIAIVPIRWVIRPLNGACEGELDSRGLAGTANEKFVLQELVRSFLSMYLRSQGKSHKVTRWES